MADINPVPTRVDPQIQRVSPELYRLLREMIITLQQLIERTGGPGTDFIVEVREQLTAGESRISTRQRVSEQETGNLRSLLMSERRKATRLRQDVEQLEAQVQSQQREMRRVKQELDQLNAKVETDG